MCSWAFTLLARRRCRSTTTHPCVGPRHRPSPSCSRPQDIRQIADAVKDYVEAFETSQHENDETVRLTVWNDQSSMLRDRLGALMGSGVQGLLLVLVILALFLRPSVALWVAVGIPIALLGATFLLLVFGITINLNSIIGFILVLGMLVDDAVVVGEAAYVSQRSGTGQLAGAIDGTERVLVPVTFGVLTTVAAFLPMLYMTGTAGTVLANVGAVVVCCLALSLVECLFVLPAHLGHRSDSLPFGEFGMVFLAILVLGAIALAPSLRFGIALGIVALGLVWAAQLWGGLQRVGPPSRACRCVSSRASTSSSNGTSAAPSGRRWNGPRSPSRRASRRC